MARVYKKKHDTTNELHHEEIDKIKCINCGTSNQNNFYQSKDRFHKHYGKIPYCKMCTKEIYSYYIKKYKNMNLAVYYTCRKIDAPYIHSNYQGAVNNINNPESKIKGEDAIIQAYMKGLSFSEQNGWGSSFDESMGEREIDGLSSFDEITKIKKKQINPNNIDTDKYEIIEYNTDELQQKWGMFDNEDLAYLESEYLDWNDRLHGISDKQLDIYIIEICKQYNEIRHDREEGNNVDKKLKTLQDLFKNSGLGDSSVIDDDSNTIGMTIRDIEYHRPIKSVDPDFKDVDKISDMIIEFTGAMCRALGKENYYTQKFTELMKDYTIDMQSAINHKPDIKEIEQENSNIINNGDLHE